MRALYGSLSSIIAGSMRAEFEGGALATLKKLPNYKHIIRNVIDTRFR